MATTARTKAETDRLFYSGVSLAVAVTVFAGFARTYYLSSWFPPPARMPPMTPLLHVHGLVFTIWTVILVVQPLLVAAGRRGLHRTLGWVGAATAAAVWLLGNLASIAAMKQGFRGVGDPYAFYAVTFFSIQAFGIIIVLAILWRDHAETHKRLVLLSSAAVLEAAFGRLPLDIMAQTAPFSFYVGSDLIILAGILYDRSSRGAVHKVWLWGGGVLVLSQVLRIAIMQTEPWLAFARWMAGPG
jgi:hypothetical protein